MDFINLYYKFELLEDAANLAVFYISALKQYLDKESISTHPSLFINSMVNFARTNAPFSTWLPVNTIDLILQGLTANSNQPNLAIALKSLKEALDSYKALVIKYSKALEPQSSVVAMRT